MSLDCIQRIVSRVCVYVYIYSRKSQLVVREDSGVYYSAKYYYTVESFKKFNLFATAFTAEDIETTEKFYDRARHSNNPKNAAA